MMDAHEELPASGVDPMTSLRSGRTETKEQITKSALADFLTKESERGVGSASYPCTSTSEGGVASTIDVAMPNHADDDDEEDESDEANEFTIPKKLTKSGRKRATPFPMKVRNCCTGVYSLQ